MKKAIAAVLVLAVAVFIYVTVALDYQVERYIERTAGRLTGVPVSLEDVELSLFSAAGEIRGLRVGNPPGFSDNPAFTLEAVRFDLQPRSLLFPPLVLDELVFIAPVVNLEFSDGLRSNLGVIQDTIRAAGKKRGKGRKGRRDGYRVSISRLEIDEIQFSARRGSVNWDGAAPGISMQGVGGEDGVEARALAGLLTKEITGQVLDQGLDEVTGSGPVQGIREAAKSLGERLGERLRESLFGD